MGRVKVDESEEKYVRKARELLASQSFSEALELLSRYIYVDLVESTNIGSRRGADALAQKILLDVVLGDEV